MDEVSPLVITGPSGVGKGTLIDMLREKFKDQFSLVVSHTTRHMRPGEVDGVHYHFVSPEAIQADVDQGLFLEHAEVHGRHYGTSFRSVEDILRAGQVPILDVDVQGVQKIKQRLGGDSLPFPLAPFHFLFIAPPSIDVLRERLRGRGTETEEQLATRLGNAPQELEYGLAEGNFDVIVTNTELEQAFNDLTEHIRTFYPFLRESTEQEAKEEGGN
jgi:guanylate kinase